MNIWFWYLCCSVLIVCDQISKFWALHALTPYQARAVFPGLNWTLLFNSGSAFGFLNQSGVWWHQYGLTAFGIVMSAGLIVWIARSKTKSHLELLALTMVLSGALGNVIDRLRFGYVVDFIQVYYKSHYFPVFNLADSAICVGAGLLFLASCLENRRR